jgi:hypothetical protein
LFDVPCDQCQRFRDRQRIDDPFFYRDVVRQLTELVDTGVLELVGGTCPLRSLLDPDNRWPADIVRHEFRCPGCDQRFALTINTYHGSAGAWEPIR